LILISLTIKIISLNFIYINIKEISLLNIRYMIVQKLLTRVVSQPKSFKLLEMRRGFQYSTQFVKEGKEKLVGSWLFLSATGVLCMIVLGGYTRLSHSGLSMVDWKPFTSKYPKTDQEWNV
jgi:hypothetical protein